MYKRLVVVIFLTLALFLPAPAETQGQETKPGETFLLLMAARNALRIGKYDTAINRYRRLLAKSPQLAAARKELGWVLLDIDKAPEAIKEFTIVFKAAPQDIGALKGLLEGFRKTENKQEVFRFLELLVTLVPEDRGLRLQLATKLHNKGKYAEAEKHISILLEEKNEAE